MKEYKGIIITIEGGDASGKETQSIMLRDYILNKVGFENGENFERISFPMYGANHASMIEMYLRGEFGNSPDDVDPYTASMMYAIDRSISYKQDNWGKVYNRSGIIISDRYMESNIIHQSIKIPVIKENISKDIDPHIINQNPYYQDFVEWCYDTEHNKIGLPRTDLLIILRSNYETYKKLISSRNSKQDIHEKNIEYMKYVYKSIDILIDYYKSSNSKRKKIFGNTKMYCLDIVNSNGIIRSYQDIHQEIVDAVNKFFINKIKEK